MRDEPTPNEAKARATAPDSPALRLWIILSRAYHAVEAHARADFSRQGLTPGEFGALEALYHLGPLSLGTLQEKILVSSGGITWVADRLEERGLLVRSPSPTDRRVTLVRLAPDGRALMDRIFPMHREVLERALGGMPESEMSTLADALRRLGHHAAALDLPSPEHTETQGAEPT